MDPSRFDDLTKALATGTSRRQALKTIAAAALGSLLSLGGIDAALASNSTCAKFCNAVFGADTDAANQCISDAAHHRGLCYTCGPASSGGGVSPSSLCCVRNGGGYCSSYGGVLCSCDSSQCLTCDSTTGTCVLSCSSGQSCINGACCPGLHICRSYLTGAEICCSCGSCVKDKSGTYYCTNKSSIGPTCTSDSDCPSGYFCAIHNNTGGLCIQACA